MPSLRQTANKQEPEGVNRCRVVFTNETLPNNLIIAIASVIREDYKDAKVVRPPGFLTAFVAKGEDVELHFWYKEGAAPLTTVEVYVSTTYTESIQVHLLEVSGIAVVNALDKFVWRTGESSSYIDSGQTGTLAATNEFCVSAVVNKYASTSQQGFVGGFTRLIETLTPSRDPDGDRSRVTIHSIIAAIVNPLRLTARLSCGRDWAAGIACFKSGITGPARFTSRNPVTRNKLTVTPRASLTAFGPLKSTVNKALFTVSSPQARIGPFNYQYRVNGWNGLLIGSGTKFYVEGTEGLYGWQVRTSDEDLPRGDGAFRGVDLESARQIMFKMNVGKGRDEVEANMDLLYRYLIPQRDVDWELIWRHPNQPLKMLRCRPIDLLRDRSAKQLLFSTQSFVLRAADPRHYSAIPTVVDIPVTTNPLLPNYETLQNIGSSASYPTIAIKGPTSGPPVTRVELVNVNGLYNFDVRLNLPKGSELRADMEARITGVSRNIITLNGQTKYGAWQLPREPFRLEPDPVLPNGNNVLYVVTEPKGAPITCTVTYRDTWSG